ncbi:HAD family hydrolase [Halorarius litoreus]|uniref:HAD family hydrolase n=1 Tax=Halorarius litoreus TaxID=2962676 RepID=UPI0020CED2A6|nr:HAD family hydrolase [Halorarius litoreus]
MQAVGFDLDETLAVTTRDRSRILADASERADAPPLSRDAYLDAHAEHSGSASREPVFDALLDGHDTEATGGELAEAYGEAIEAAMEPLAGVPDLVRTLQRSYPVGLLTDGPVETQWSKLRTLGWTELFDVALVTGGLPAPKPADTAFLALAAELDVAPERIVYVGDHPENDIVGAAGVGMTTVQVLYDGGPDPHPDATATVRREALVEELPRLVAEFD